MEKIQGMEEKRGRQKRVESNIKMKYQKESLLTKGYEVTSLLKAKGPSLILLNLCSV